ncbi:MAG: nuclear transport factor 2 family protein [Pseudomonadota bacterium]|nr:nuclear transport factor 2 family protein [Pseudomonadota bacterium]
MTPLSVARQAFAFYLVGDKAGVLALTDPHATWTFPGDPSVVPWAGTFHGAGIARFMDLLVDHLDYEEARVESVTAAGDRVFVQAYERYVVRATGRVCHNRLAGAFTVRDGRILAYEEYSDTAAMERASA